MKLFPDPRLPVLAACVAFAAFAPSARADEIPITPEARTHFTAGVRLLEDPAGARYEEAYQEFKVAYASSPSPRILGNVGLCAMKLERDEEAIQAYEKYLASDAKIEPTERTQIETDLGTLKASVVHVTLTVDAAEARVVDVRTPVQGAAVTNVYGPLTTASIRLGIHPGHHAITVKRDGYTPASWELDAVPGSSPTHAFALQKVVVAPAPVAPVILPVAMPAPQPAPPDVITRPVPASVYGVGGVTVALAAVSALTGALALAKHNDFDQINDGTAAHYQDALSLRSTGQSLNVATDALLGATVVGAAVTLGLYATRPTVRAPAAALRLRMGATGAAIEGGF